jgi:hypothetical protein
MEVRSAVCTVLVILLVLVSSGLSATTLVTSLRPASENSSKELNVYANLNRFLTVIISMIENWMSSKLFDLQPHPIKSFVFLVKEVLYVVQNLGKRLHELLLKPRNLIFVALPYMAALALIVMSFTPGYILPSKVIAFVLSIFRMFNGYWAPFHNNYLAHL